jgi:Type I phosphodiesterase / nucleotide pyrophosphatase
VTDRAASPPGASARDASAPDASAPDASASDPPVPDYGARSLPGLMRSVLRALGVPDDERAAGDVAAGEADLAVPPSRRIAVVLVDGLGWTLLRRHPAEAAFLSTLLPDAYALSAGFPATTATSLGSLGTGLPPGEHGLLGYQVRVPGQRRLLNALHWDRDVDPMAWQPQPTAYERAARAGVSVTQVAPATLRNTGLTLATLRGATYVAADTPGERVAATLATLRATDRALVGTYYGELDATGHRNGCQSQAWRLQLAHVDRFVEQLAEGLPAGTTLLITADHGMVDVPPQHRFDVDGEPGLTDGVALLGGEGRARHVYTDDGAADDVLAAWQELLGGDAWVLSRDAAVSAGWFGPRVADRFRPRIGDVVAAAQGDAAIVATQREPQESALVGVHGSLTPEEQLVPLLKITA